MRSFAAGALRRRVGLDRNPLLRGSDRVEAAIAAVLMVAFIAGLGGAWHAGKQAYDAGVAAERAQAATRRLIVATVVQDAHKSPGSAEAPMVTQRVRAVWQAPDGTVRGGRVRVPTSTKAGTQTSVWIDQSGRIVPPPQSRSDTVARAALIAVGATTGIALLLRLTFAAVHWMLDRRRLARWAADWARIEPRWTRRR
jgi:hypothetical protein